MVLECIPTGMFGSNCYIAGDNGDGVVIDPGTDVETIIKTAEKNGLTIKFIILTHGHIDHICSANKLRQLTGAHIAAHRDEIDIITNPQYNGSALFGEAAAFNNVDIVLTDGDIIESGGLKLEIIHTPGHTPGGICIKTGDNLFTGDTLFRKSIGRTDLGGGNYKNLIYSIKSRLMTLEDEVKVYPGHGESSTIGFERKNNPFL